MICDESCFNYFVCLSASFTTFQRHHHLDSSHLYHPDPLQLLPFLFSSSSISTSFGLLRFHNIRIKSHPLRRLTSQSNICSKPFKLILPPFQYSVLHRPSSIHLRILPDMSAITTIYTMPKFPLPLGVSRAWNMAKFEGFRSSKSSFFCYPKRPIPRIEPSKTKSNE